MHSKGKEGQGDDISKQSRIGKEAIKEWLIVRVAQECGLEPAEIDPEAPFSRFGLDSVQAVTIVGELEQFLGRRLDPALVWDHPSIAALTEALTRDKP